MASLQHCVDLIGHQHKIKDCIGIEISVIFMAMGPIVLNALPRGSLFGVAILKE